MQYNEYFNKAKNNLFLPNVVECAWQQMTSVSCRFLLISLLFMNMFTAQGYSLLILLSHQQRQTTIEFNTKYAPSG